MKYTLIALSGLPYFAIEGKTIPAACGRKMKLAELADNEPHQWALLIRHPGNDVCEIVTDPAKRRQRIHQGW